MCFESGGGTRLRAEETRIVQEGFVGHGLAGSAVPVFPIR